MINITAPECRGAEVIDFDTILSGPFYKLFIFSGQN
jgi:hypothetical protein